MKTKLLIASLFVVTAGVVLGYPLSRDAAVAVVRTLPPEVASVPVTAAARPRIDVVFVLDTTSSMSGLIDAAKENIWSIASSMAAAQPTPELRIGLVAFRDRGDSYVTRVVDLSTDIDSMYATLMDFRAEGGGDSPESVNQALYDAVHGISWTQDDSAYKVIFLVGDAPPHMDYPDDVKYPESIRAATGKGIVVNTILAGNATDTAKEWQAMAQANQGEFFTVEAGGDAIAVDTRFDSEIAALSRELDDTRMFYGDAKVQTEMKRKEAATDKLNAGASPASLARRATFNVSKAGQANLLGKNDIVDAVVGGRVDLDSIEADQLPEPLKGLSKDAQLKTINESAARREAISERLADLAQQRQAVIEEELEKRDDTEASLDYQIFRTVKAQAAKKGLAYDAAPVH